MVVIPRIEIRLYKLSQNLNRLILNEFFYCQGENGARWVFVLNDIETSLFSPTLRQNNVFLRHKNIFHQESPLMKEPTHTYQLERIYNFSNPKAFPVSSIASRLDTIQTRPKKFRV